MEFVSLKKTRNRKRKRNVKNKRRVQRKFEVKASTRRISFNHSAMDAHSFWENYQLAQEWQQKHSIAWWKSRCFALEHENNILRQKIRSQASQREVPISSHVAGIRTKAVKVTKGSNSQRNENSNDDDDENLEFQVDKNMLDFLEQSIRHKMELKRSRESAMAVASEENHDKTEFVTCQARMLAKTEDARLLYGEASPGIMAMEAALQATIDRHKDRANPHYWPNIPLKP